MPEAHFDEILPLLRRAFSNFTPPEREKDVEDLPEQNRKRQPKRTPAVALPSIKTG